MPKQRRMFRCSDGRERPEGALKGRWLREWNNARHAMNKVNQLRIALDFVCFANPDVCHFPIEAHRYSRIRSGMDNRVSCPRCKAMYELGKNGRWRVIGVQDEDGVFTELYSASRDPELREKMPVAPVPKAPVLARMPYDPPSSRPIDKDRRPGDGTLRPGHQFRFNSSKGRAAGIASGSARRRKAEERAAREAARGEANDERGG